MHDAEWRQWLVDYTTMFGISEAEGPMVVSWRRAFEANGFTLAELQSAALGLTALPSTVFRRDHLQAIIAHVRGERTCAARILAQQSPEADERGTCSFCGDSGWISSLPHLKNVRDGVWLGLYETAALCLCRRGDKIHQNYLASERNPPLRIDQYEDRNPNFREQIADRKNEDKTLAEAQRQASEADHLFGPLIRRIQEQNKH